LQGKKGILNKQQKAAFLNVFFAPIQTFTVGFGLYPNPPFQFISAMNPRHWLRSVPHHRRLEITPPPMKNLFIYKWL